MSVSTMSEVRKKQLEDTIEKMKKASSNFYYAAVRIENHPFIEFTGLMNEYIKVCEDNLKAGIDFTQCSVHTGMRMRMEEYQVGYLHEKLDCIYGTDLLRRINDEPEGESAGHVS